MWSSLFRSTNVALNGCHIIKTPIAGKTPIVSQHFGFRHNCHYYKRLYCSLNDDRHERYGDNSDGEHEKRQQRCYNAFTQCGYQLLTSKFLETLGYLGAAIVFGLNFESRFCHSSSSRLRAQIGDGLIQHTNRSHSSHKVCGGCKYCYRFIYRLITFASPIQKCSSNVLPAINDKIELNNAIISENDELKNDSIQSLPKKDPIDELCDQIQSASIEYVDQLTNMLGIALIATNPNEAMLCWQSCKSNTRGTSSALFNIAVAYESGKHTSTGEADLTRAFYYYRLAANKGHKFAIYNLSLFYLYGKGGIEVNKTKAETLLKRAAQLGVKRAKQYCDEMYSQQSNEIIEQNNPQIKTSVSAPNLLQLCAPFNILSDSFANDMNKYDTRLMSINKIPQSLRYLL